MADSDSSTCFQGYIYSLDIYNIVYQFSGLRGDCDCNYCTPAGDCLIPCDYYQYSMENSCFDLGHLVHVKMDALNTDSAVYTLILALYGIYCVRVRHV